MEKRYDSQIAEQEAQQKWEKEQTYSHTKHDGALFSIDTPPPTVSGSLHIGHIFSYTQTDILARYHRMNGFKVFYPFGFDDNGLPTERFVEKKRKIRAHQLSRSEFIKICLEETKVARDEFKHLWQRMGLSVDWSYWYSTISPETTKISQESFLRLYKKGFVHRQDEPALYCITCRTSVAQAELDDKELPSTFNNIVFADNKGNDLVIGTTRPELLPSCVALLYHPDDERYQHLKGTQAKVPLFDFTVPVLPDELVDIEKGTGLVMCCTFGDKTDIEWFKKHTLPYKQSIGFDGKFVKGTGILEGLKVLDARKKVLEELEQKNLVISQKSITHPVSVHERCKKEIEYVVLRQWFMNILEHKQQFLDLANQVKWYPSFMKTRYINWVENLNWDWCISRQRFYGIPFPVWYCTACNKVLVAQESQLPVDPQETPYQGPCPECGGTDIVPDTDVMDTWNTSSLTPYICKSLFEKTTDVFSESGEFIPMGMRPQAHDIIRTWAFYTIVKTWMHHTIAPWKEVVISGHVLSDNKEKLSKSKDGKKLAPETLLSRYPADVIRYWTASGNLGYDVAFSENQLKIGQKLVTKLWNAFRFASTHLEHLQNPDQLPDEFGLVNEWLLHNVSVCFDQYKGYLNNNEFGLALGVVEKFFWNDFCDNYLELVKHQLFNPDEYDRKHVDATRWTLYNVGLRLLQMYAPYLPHVTEKIYAVIYQPHTNVSSIHETKFSSIQQTYSFDASTRLMNIVLSITDQVRKLKSDNQLSLKVPLKTLTIHATEEDQVIALEPHKPLLRGVTQAQEIVIGVSASDRVDLTEKKGEWHAIVVVAP